MTTRIVLALVAFTAAVLVGAVVPLTLNATGHDRTYFVQATEAVARTRRGPGPGPAGLPFAQDDRQAHATGRRAAGCWNLNPRCSSRWRNMQHRVTACSS